MAEISKMKRGSKKSKDSRCVVHADPGFGTSDDNDVPIFVIEAEIRSQQKADYEHAVKEARRLKALQNAQRRKELVKVFLLIRLYNISFVVYKIIKFYFRRNNVKCYTVKCNLLMVFRKCCVV